MDFDQGSTLRVSERIADILERRRTQLPLVRKDIARWQKMKEDIETLDVAVQEMRTHAGTRVELKENLATFSVHDLCQGIKDALERLSVLEARYARGTINIGVSGRARVGKSTLLQAISGLGEDQIPTGSGLPVTAVRSRIFHSDTSQRAILSLHSFDTFRDTVLRPYHDMLRLPAVPATVDDFRTWPYQNGAGRIDDSADEHSHVTLRRRLRDMQLALGSFEDDLVGGERVVGLNGLRDFVAYPTNEESKTGTCRRRYLAVRDVRIECPFPYAQVEQVGIIDLPGLGELAAHAEEHHLDGLRNEVDIVLLVKRPKEGMAYWGREDGGTTDLLDKARGAIKNRNDFVFIVINSGKDEATLAEVLRDDVRKSANDGVDGKHFRVLETDATSQKSVYESVLAPVLQHLSERLPVMDEEIFEDTRYRDAALGAAIKSMLSELEATLSQISISVVNIEEDVIKRSDVLRKDLAGALDELVQKLMAEARSNNAEPDYLAAVESAYQDIRVWIESGFGDGEEAWVSNALRTMRVDKHSSRFAGDELNRIRVEISKRYHLLDNFFTQRVDQLWADLAPIFVKHLGGLLAGKVGVEALRYMRRLFLETTPPCRALSGAVDDLLDLRMDYRTHLHHKVRREFDGLNLQVINPQSRKLEDQIVVAVSESGAEELLSFITDLANQAVYHAKKLLLLEALTPALIVHAAIEQFEDTLIRSKESESEFRRMIRKYKDEIWPGAWRCRGIHLPSHHGQPA